MGNDAENLLNRIGLVLAESLDDSSNASVLYADIHIGDIGGSVFEDKGSHILYHDRLEIFADTLYDLWLKEPEARRWEQIIYVLRDGKFDAEFVYPDQIDPEEDSFDRRDRIIASRLGEKPIVYPPWDGDGAFEL